MGDPGTKVRPAVGLDAPRPWRARLAPPRWGIWLVPAALYPLLASTFPIGYRTHPGDDSIWAAAAAFVVVLGYGGLLLGVLLWVWLGSRLFTGTRNLLAWQRKHGYDELFWVIVLMAGICGCVVTNLVASFYAPRRAHSLRGPDIAVSDLLGWGREGNAPSLWVMRAATLGSGLCFLGIVWMIARIAPRRRMKG